MKRNHLLALGTLLTAAVAVGSIPMLGCGGATAPVEAGDASDAQAAADARAKEAAAYVSCAFTAEPAKEAPCTQYLGIRGDLAACGIPDASAAGALPPETCRANCGTTSCSLVLDAAVAPGIVGPGYPGIACGCK
jgi:hypothetical protein